MAWMTPDWPLPEGAAESRRTATRVIPGAICLSSSGHLPLKLYSIDMNPVALPPGRAKLSTKPPPTGSATFTKTTGTVRVACSNGPTVEAPCLAGFRFGLCLLWANRDRVGYAGRVVRFRSVPKAELAPVG
jgi:hypothetical protein